MSTINQTFELNQAEKDMVSKLPEALRKQVEDTILSAKKDAWVKVNANRTEFKVSINELGTVVIRGLGNRFPTGLRHDQIRTILAHPAELSKAADDAESYIKTNMDKVKGLMAERSKRRAEHSRKLQAIEKLQLVK